MQLSLPGTLLTHLKFILGQKSRSMNIHTYTQKHTPGIQENLELLKINKQQTKEHYSFGFILARSGTKISIMISGH